MKCSKIRFHLQDYLDNTLSVKMKRDLEEHLKDCPDCSAELAFIKKFHQETKVIPKAEVPVNLLSNIHRQLAEEKTTSKMTNWFWPLPVQLTGAAGVLAVIILMFFIFNPMKSAEPSLYKTMNQDPNLMGTKKEAPSTTSNIQTKPIVTEQKQEIRPVIILSMNTNKSTLRMAESSTDSGFALEKSSKGIASKALGPEAVDSNADISKEETDSQDNDVTVTLRKLVQTHQGQVLKEEKDQTTGEQKQWFIKIPGKNYFTFLNDLSMLGNVTKPITEQKLPPEIILILKFKLEP